MMKIQRRYWILAGIILAFAGCDKLIYDQQDPEGNGSTVYLSINTRVAHTDGRESINTDNADFEDRVHHLALLVFDSSTGNKVGEPYFKDYLGSGESTYAFTAKMTAGKTYDLYFVANRPDLETTMEGTTTRNEMDTFMGNLHDLAPTHYSGAETGNGFPMARVYRNQTIPAGGTIYQPVPFKLKYTEGGINAATRAAGSPSPWLPLSNTTFSNSVVPA